jgi:quercetin dioxygenase-like cupin family protein
MTDTIEPATSSGPIPMQAMTHAMHIGESDLPWVDGSDGSSLQLLQVDLNVGLWVVRTRFPAGFQVTKHYHTGSVFAVTLAGSWFYKEYPDFVNTAGSYLYEPAHSVHTLMVGDDNTEVTDVWFAIYGSNINVDEDGEVIGITDAQSILGFYQHRCAELGLDCSALIINGQRAG